MRFFILIISLLFFAIQAQAVKIGTVNYRSKYGNMVVKVVETGEPVYMPYLVTIMVYCKDRNRKRSEIRPKVQILHKMRVCELEPYDFNKQTGVLTLRFATSETPAGLAKCDSYWSQTFNQDEACRPWSR